MSCIASISAVVNAFFAPWSLSASEPSSGSRPHFASGFSPRAAARTASPASLMNLPNAENLPLSFGAFAGSVFAVSAGFGLAALAPDALAGVLSASVLSQAASIASGSNQTKRLIEHSSNRIWGKGRERYITPPVHGRPQPAARRTKSTGASNQVEGSARWTPGRRQRTTGRTPSGFLHRQVSRKQLLPTDRTEGTTQERPGDWVRDKCFGNLAGLALY